MGDFILVAVIGYLFGNIQASYILGKLIKKVDIRTLGQGNAGASNAVESLGVKFGMIVALIDILKALISILLVKELFHVGLDAAGSPLLYLNGYCVILGHVYPFYMNFKGGKGIAALMGMLFGLHPLIGVGGIAVMTTVTFLGDYISLGSMALSIYAVLITMFLRLGVFPIGISLAGMLLIFYLHVPNFRRIAKKKEVKVSSVLFKKKKL
ncbi:MAG: glycerol-3-phosphate acyltransferase [Erysipelotrichales bacterium]|nr:MAG: glycerol-3-phosphate acyltransferase [Erysipelotrichales bacterium]